MMPITNTKTATPATIPAVEPSFMEAAWMKEDGLDIVQSITATITLLGLMRTQMSLQYIKVLLRGMTASVKLHLAERILLDEVQM